MHIKSPSRTAAALGIGMLFTATPLVWAQSAPGAAPATARPAARPAQVPANTPYAIGAQRNGIVKCIGRINQVTSFLTGSNANSGMVLNSPTAEANQRLASTVIEVAADNVTSFISASYSPGSGATDCSATYDAVTYWTGSCAQVAGANFAAFKPTRPLLKSVNILDGGPMVKVFLMPAGTGCISIKKEMVF